MEMLQKLRDYLNSKPLAELKEEWDSIAEYPENGVNAFEFINSYTIYYEKIITPYGNELIGCGAIDTNNLTSDFSGSFFFRKIAA